MAMLIIIMGVSASGKTTIASALAAKLKCPFVEGDAHHSPGNIATMRAGHPLSDADRLPWIDSIIAAIERCDPSNTVVVACSALNNVVRARLSGVRNRRLVYVHLAIQRSAAEARMRARQHFMPVGLLGSQFDSLTVPPNALSFDATRPVEELVHDIVEALQG